MVEVAAWSPLSKVILAEKVWLWNRLPNITTKVRLKLWLPVPSEVWSWPDLSGFHLQG